MSAPLRLVVLGDSTSFTDDRGPQLPDEPTLYPNVLAGELAATLDREVALTVVARAGMTVREATRTVTKDRHVQFDLLLGADAVVLGVGSFDHAPGGIPAVVDAVVPYLRPAALRRRARIGLHAAYPWAVRLTAHRRRRTPPAEFERLYDLLLLQVRGLARGAGIVALGPTSHRAAYYAWRHPGHAAAAAHQAEVAGRHGVPSVACWPFVEPHADALNPDGIHWPAPAHAAVGAALAESLAAQLTGRAPRPPAPTWDRSGGTAG
ncbi:MAG: hypothetical protein KY461_03260 [Actinobacteria bacterium]|nr:hypothetical protein [Actinomycetota bacterium]